MTLKPSVIVLAILLQQVVGDVSSDLVSNAANIFANRLYKQIISTSQGNQLICPISLDIALALVYEGAGGKTAQEIATTLAFNGISGSNGDIKQGYKSILSNTNDNTLQIATKLYPAQGYQLNSTYLQVAREYFYSDVEEVDYNNPTAAANTINKYVEKKTNNKIHDLITPDSLDGNTKLVLINAVYFEAKWKQPFSSAYEGYFRVTPQNKVMTRMMSLNGDFMYKVDPALNAKVLKMDYQVGNYSMIFILPNKEENGLAEVEQKLADMTLPQILNNMSESNVEVTIPKFTLEQTIDLKDILEKMGITDLFSSNADLKKIANGGDNLYVSKVVQKTFINVYESGTEAAAATGFIETLSAVPDIIVFNARRPFLFYLIHAQKPKQIKVLFQGRFAVPKEVEPKEKEEKKDQIVGSQHKESISNNAHNNQQNYNLHESETVEFPIDEDEDDQRFVIPHYLIPTPSPPRNPQYQTSAPQYTNNYNNGNFNNQAGNQNRPSNNIPQPTNNYNNGNFNNQAVNQNRPSNNIPQPTNNYNNGNFNSQSGNQNRPSNNISQPTNNYNNGNFNSQAGNQNRPSYNNQYSPQRPPYTNSYDNSEYNRQLTDGFAIPEHALPPQTNMWLNQNHQVHHDYQRFHQEPYYQV